MSVTLSTNTTLTHTYSPAITNLDVVSELIKRDFVEHIDKHVYDGTDTVAIRIVSTDIDILNTVYDTRTATGAAVDDPDVQCYTFDLVPYFSLLSLTAEFGGYNIEDVKSFKKEEHDDVLMSTEHTAGLQDSSNSSVGLSKFKGVRVEVAVKSRHDEDAVVGSILAAVKASPERFFRKKSVIVLFFKSIAEAQQLITYKHGIKDIKSVAHPAGADISSIAKGFWKGGFKEEKFNDVITKANTRKRGRAHMDHSVHDDSASHLRKHSKKDQTIVEEAVRKFAGLTIDDGRKSKKVRV